MGVEIEEALAGLVDLEKAPRKGPVLLFIEGFRRDVRCLGHPEGAAVKQGEYAFLVEESGSFSLIHAVVPAYADAAVL